MDLNQQITLALSSTATTTTSTTTTTTTTTIGIGVGIGFGVYTKFPSRASTGDYIAAYEGRGISWGNINTANS